MQGTILSNRYLISEEIGVGGMGNVYRAVDLRTGGEVAVKIPHAFLARNLEYVERLRREAQIAASVYSPRVVRVFDLHEHEGVPYLVMEYVPGDTLAETLRRVGRFSMEEALTIGLEVARALEAAHAKEIVHRDLKPQNIKLVDGEVKVLDFGIAKAEGYASVTAADVFIGTAEYCAPERADGLGDIRSDIYSLGIIVWEMREGQLPFQAVSPMALMRKHETEPPPPLSGEVPTLVQGTLATMLAKRPQDRYQTPRELVQALRRALESPTSAVAQTLQPEAVPNTVQHATKAALSPTAGAGSLPATLVAPDDWTDEPLTGDQQSAVAAAGATDRPSTSRPAASGTRPRALIAAGALALAALAVIAVVALRSRNGDDRAAVLPTAPAAGATPGPSALVQSNVARTPPGSGVAPLLQRGGAPITEGLPRYEFLVADACPGVKVIYQITSLSAAASGRVTVGYAVSAPRVQDVPCEIEYPPDVSSDVYFLETRRANGSVVAVRNAGGRGVAETGSADLYGTPPAYGELWFDNVELQGVELIFVRELPGNDIRLIELPLVER